MPRRHHPIPRVWLMTDERMGDALWDALERLPRGGRVVFRHYDLPVAERLALLAAVTRIARRRRLVVVAAGGLSARDGVHNRRSIGRGLVTRSAHDRRELVAAVRAGADAIFVSPVFATRSHPGARPIGPVRLGLMTRGIRTPMIALGGMTPARFNRLKPFGIHGWAAIDAWTRQKRNAVPT